MRPPYHGPRRLGLGFAPLPDLTELLEAQGVRTAMVELPSDVSGLTLSDRKVGLFVVANDVHHYLRLLTEAELVHFKALDEEGKGRQLATTLGLSEPDPAETRGEFKHRFLGLALEAYRRDEISRGKLRELVAMVGVNADDLDQLLDNAGLDGEDDPTP